MAHVQINNILYLNQAANVNKYTLRLTRTQHG